MAFTSAPRPPASVLHNSPKFRIAGRVTIAHAVFLFLWTSEMGLRLKLGFVNNYRREHGAKEGTGEMKGEVSLEYIISIIQA